MCACVCVYAAAHILSPVQIKPRPTIRSDDKQEDGGARSPDGRLEGRRGTRGRERRPPVCMITNPAVAGRHYRSAPWPSHKRRGFDIYTKLTRLRPYLPEQAQVCSHKMESELSAPVESRFIILLFQLLLIFSVVVLIRLLQGSRYIYFQVYILFIRRV